MKMNEMGIPDVKALVAFGKLGLAILASRMISLISIVGILALSGYVAYSPSYPGAACVCIVSLFCFMPALRAESGRAKEDTP